MKYFSLYLALRYLGGIRSEQSLSTMVKICFFGIMISTFSLTLVAVVMRGFEKATFQTLQGCHSPIIMQSHGNHLAYNAIKKVLDEEFPHLTYSPSDMQYIMLEDCKGNLSQLVALKGINPLQEVQTTILEKKILPTTPINTLQSAIQKNSVLIGYKLANILNITVGDSFTAYYVPEQEIEKKNLHLDTLEFIVGGVFKTGIEEFDANLVVCSLDSLQELFPTSGITSISISFDKQYDETKIQQQLRQRFNIPVLTWKDRYPALVAALRLETYASFIIVTLIVLIASMSILSLLYMHITQKRGNIALLKAMGTPSFVIKNIFLWMGMIIAVSGTGAGLFCALISALILQKLIRIDLPDAYFVTQLPISLEASIFILVFIVVITISFLATWLATRNINSINIAQVLRFES